MGKDYRNGQSRLRSSRLESYESILEALVSRPLSLSELALETHLDQPRLARHMQSLAENGLIEERPEKRESIYAITEKGLTVIKVLDFHEYLRRIKGAIRAIEEAVESMPEIVNLDNEDQKPPR